MNIVDKVHFWAALWCVQLIMLFKGEPEVWVTLYFIVALPVLLKLPGIPKSFTESLYLKIVLVTTAPIFHLTTVLDPMFGMNGDLDIMVTLPLIFIGFFAFHLCLRKEKKRENC
ncbi:hypothetical protein [Vibrio sinaloensis]|uniref:hypothetical protein n=1 Tax=Photobacterium sp. (strain ATCC 43367) TaxID=379097 RepID=UPI0035EC4AD0